MANGHLIELATQCVLVDAQLTPAYAREVLDTARGLGKPIARLYIPHAHPEAAFRAVMQRQALTQGAAHVPDRRSRCSSQARHRHSLRGPGTPRSG